MPRFILTIFDDHLLFEYSSLVAEMANKIPDFYDKFNALISECFLAAGMSTQEIGGHDGDGIRWDYCTLAGVSENTYALVRARIREHSEGFEIFIQAIAEEIEYFHNASWAVVVWARYYSYADFGNCKEELIDALQKAQTLSISATHKLAAAAQSRDSLLSELRERGLLLE